jgi:hypothetical protein
MNWKMVSALAIAALAGTGLAGAATPSTSDGLVAVASGSLDEFYLRQDVSLSAYHRVIIDRGQAAMRSGWLKYMNGTRDLSRWLVPEDAQRITDDVASSLDSVVAEAFKAQGYEIVAVPGAGVLRLSPSVTDLFVNAPDSHSPGIDRAFVKDTGEATLRLDVRDAATGTLLGRVVDRRSAHELRRLNNATNISNLFWFDALYREFATNCARELVTAQGPH